MAKKSPKTMDGLMRHLSDHKGIDIHGSSQKRKLMNMGYYHGYKGYRYISKSSNAIPYKDFAELDAVYNFDAQLKAIFYPEVMRIETALKNYVLEAVVEEVKSDSLIDVYNTLLDNYKMYSVSGKTFSAQGQRKKAEDKFKTELKRRLELRNRLYKVQSDAFSSNNKIAEHYLSSDKNLPIWAIFELLSFGELGNFVSCLNQSCRKVISKKLGIRQSDDTAAFMPERLIYATKDLRNAIAHNNVIFDTRFKKSNIDKQVSNAITNATGVTNITFDTITDYLVLIVYQLSLIHVSKNELRKLISAFAECTERLRKEIPISIYNQIILTDSNVKISALKKFI